MTEHIKAPEAAIGDEAVERVLDDRTLSERLDEVVERSAKRVGERVAAAMPALAAAPIGDEDGLRKALEGVVSMLEEIMPRDGYDTSYRCRKALEKARAAIASRPIVEGVDRTQHGLSHLSDPAGGG